MSLVSLPDYWDMGKGSSALVPFPRGSMQETKIETGGLWVWTVLWAMGYGLWAMSCGREKVSKRSRMYCAGMFESPRYEKGVRVSCLSFFPRRPLFWVCAIRPGILGLGKYSEKA